MPFIIGCGIKKTKGLSHHPEPEKVYTGIQNIAGSEEALDLDLDRQSPPYLPFDRTKQSRLQVSAIRHPRQQRLIALSHGDEGDSHEKPIRYALVRISIIAAKSSIPISFDNNRFLQVGDYVCLVGTRVTLI